jgi:thioredoxin-dependent peroxiredoxin
VNALVVGVSADKPETQRKFIDKFGLTFPMVPDPDKVVIDAFGAREVLGLSAKRKTFLIDPEGRVAHVWPKVKVDGHADDVVATIRGLAEERG